MVCGSALFEEISGWSRQPDLDFVGGSYLNERRFLTIGIGRLWSERIPFSKLENGVRWGGQYRGGES